METLGRKLFQICDPQGKGFITRADFKILVGELSLSPEQLDLVFDRLDTTQSGIITMSHFTESVSCFMTIENNTKEETEGLYKLLQMNLLKRSGKWMMAVEESIRGDQVGRLHAHWTDLIENLTLDVELIQEQIREMEVALRRKDEQRKKDLAFFESLQFEISEEKEIAVQKEKAKSEQLQSELRERLLRKEAQCTELMELRSDLVDKFNSLFRKKKVYKNEIKLLKKELDEKKEELDFAKEQYSQLERDFKAMKKLTAEECRRSFQEGVEDGRKMSDEEAKGVLEELEMLQSILNSLEGASRLPLVDEIS